MISEELELYLFQSQSYKRDLCSEKPSLVCRTQWHSMTAHTPRVCGYIFRNTNFALLWFLSMMDWLHKDKVDQVCWYFLLSDHAGTISCHTDCFGIVVHLSNWSSELRNNLHFLWCLQICRYCWDLQFVSWLLGLFWHLGFFCVLCCLGEIPHLQNLHNPGK